MASKEQLAILARGIIYREKAGLPSPSKWGKESKNICRFMFATVRHNSFLSMMTRCVWSYLKKRPDFHLYKDTGITVCERLDRIL